MGRAYCSSTNRISSASRWADVFGRRERVVCCCFGDRAAASFVSFAGVDVRRIRDCDGAEVF